MWPLVVFGPGRPGARFPVYESKQKQDRRSEVRVRPHLPRNGDPARDRVDAGPGRGCFILYTPEAGKAVGEGGGIGAVCVLYFICLARGVAHSLSDKV